MTRKKPATSALETKIDRLTKVVGRGFAAVSEDIADIRTHMAAKDELAELKTELKADIAGVKSDIAKLDDRMVSVESKVGGIHNRIDGETFARKDLEARVRRVLPKLPAAQQ